MTFADFKIFAKTLYPLVKFDEKHDGAVDENVRPTGVELYQNFVQKCGTEQLQMVPA